MLGLVGALLLGGAVFFIVYSTQMAAEASAVKDRLGLDLGGGDKGFRPPFYLLLTKPLLKGGYLSLAAGFWKEPQLEVWRRKIRAAGLHRYVDATQVVASKFWLTLMVFGFLVLSYIFSDNGIGLWFVFAASAVVFFLPNLHINGLKDKRQTEVRLGMPYVIDLMTLSMEAGQEFQGAITKVVERAPKGPFIEELQDLLKNISAGLSRAESLRAMSKAIDIPEITSLVAILVSADQQGSPIGPVLRAQSDSMRVERLVKAEKLGAQASQKILIPLVFFILPAVFLMIFGPIILQMLGQK